LISDCSIIGNKGKKYEETVSHICNFLHTAGVK